MAPPCETWSIARTRYLKEGVGPPPLRNADALWGLEGLTLKQYMQLAQSSTLLRVAIDFFILLVASGGFAIMEHPSEAYWDCSSASIWKLSIIKLLVKAPSVKLHRFDQGIHGQVSQKPTSPLTLRAPTIDRYLHQNQLPDSQPMSKPQEPLIGQNDAGQWNTAAAKEYTPSFCLALAKTVHDILQSNFLQREQVPHSGPVEWPNGFEILSAPLDIYDPDCPQQEMGYDYSHYNHHNRENHAATRPLPAQISSTLPNLSRGLDQSEAINEARTLLADRAPTDDDVLNLLHKWKFKQNHMRQNVTPEGSSYVVSTTLGFATPKDPCVPPMLTSDTRGCGDVVKVLSAWVQPKLEAKYCLQTIAFTSIAVKSGFASKIHRDKGNMGPPIAISIGSFEGGLLKCCISDNRRDPLHSLQRRPSIWLNTHLDPYIFDGTQAHSVTPVTGHRYSLVFYSCSRFHAIPPELAAQAQAMCGISGATDERLSLLRAKCLGISDPPPPIGTIVFDPTLRLRIQQNREQAQRKRQARLQAQSAPSIDDTALRA